MPFMPLVVGAVKLAATAKGLMAIAVATTAVGTAMQMKGAKQSAKSEAALYRYNAEIAKREAEAQRRASMEEQHIQKDSMRRALKRNRALYAKGKVMMTGSPLEVQLATVETMAADIATLATERELGVSRARSRIGLERFRAGAAEQAGKLAVGTTLVGGVSDISKLGISYYLNK